MSHNQHMQSLDAHGRYPARMGSAVGLVVGGGMGALVGMLTGDGLLGMMIGAGLGLVIGTAIGARAARPR